MATYPESEDPEDQEGWEARAGRLLGTAFLVALFLLLLSLLWARDQTFVSGADTWRIGIPPRRAEKEAR